MNKNTRGEILLTLEEIKEQVDKLAQKIDVPANILPTYGISRRDGSPHIEISEKVYYYMAYDRDVVSMNRQTLETQELFYWIFRDITSRMGFSYARDHRDPQVNYRKNAFHHQLELLEKLNIQWKELREQEIEQILKEHPY